MYVSDVKSSSVGIMVSNPSRVSSRLIKCLIHSALCYTYANYYVNDVTLVNENFD